MEAIGYLKSELFRVDNNPTYSYSPYYEKRQIDLSIKNPMLKNILNGKLTTQIKIKFGHHRIWINVDESHLLTESELPAFWRKWWKDHH